MGGGRERNALFGRSCVDPFARDAPKRAVGAWVESITLATESAVRSLPLGTPSRIDSPASSSLDNCCLHRERRETRPRSQLTDLRRSRS